MGKRRRKISVDKKGPYDDTIDYSYEDLASIERQERLINEMNYRIKMRQIDRMQVVDKEDVNHIRGIITERYL